MTLKTKKVKIEWDTPKGDDGNPYDQLVGYEVTHNVPGFESPLKVSSDTTSSGILELPEGIYNVGVASIDYHNQKSKKAILDFEITNTILNSEAQRNFGIPIGGVISTECFINPTTGIFKTLDATGWSFASAGVPQVYRSFQNGHANRYTQDCSDIKSENFSTMTDFEAEIKSHYLIFDASDSNDPLKLVKWEDLVYSTNNDLNLGYWYDTVDGDDGTSSDLPELTFVAKTGAVTIADESNEVVGVGTSFTTEYAIDDIIYFNDTKAAKVVNIASDTSLTINKTFSTATSVSGIGTARIKKQGFMPDKNYDAVLYAIRNDQGTFKKFQMVNLTVDPDVFSRSRVATVQSAPNLLNFDATPALTTSYTNLVLTAVGNGFLSPKFKITGTGFNNSEISQTADSSFQNPTSGKTYVKTLDKVDAFVTTDLDFTVTVTEAADESNTDLQSTQSITIPFIKDGSGSGSGGSDAKVVSLTVDDYSIIYDENGSNPSPSGNMTLTATSQNFSDPYFKFTGDGIANETTFTDGSGDSDTFTFSIPTNHFSDPKSLRVGVAEAAADTTEIAFDSISITAVKPGATGPRGIDGMTFVITNEAHVFNASEAGVVSSYTGSGTIIEVYEGGTELIYDGIGTSNSRWKTTEAATNITVGTKTDSGNYLTVGNHSGVANGTDESKIIYTITGKRADGTSFTAQAQQSFTKSKKGDLGNTGPTGAQGIQGVKGDDAAGVEYIFAVTADEDTDPSDPSNSWGFDNPNNSQGWYDGLPTSGLTTTNKALWRSQRDIEGTPATGASVSDSWSDPTVVGRYADDGATGSPGSPGSPGTPGAVGKKTATGYLYYNTQQANPPGAPSNSSVTYTFSSGTMAGGVIGTGSTNWSLTAPAASGGTSGSKMYYIYWNAEETTSGGGTAAPGFGSTVYTATNFTGLVRFNGTNQVEDGLGGELSFGSGGTTVIDGGKITTGTISADRITTDLLRVTGDAMTGGTVGGWTVNSSAIFSSTNPDTSGYTTGGITLNSLGSIHAKEFYIDTDGNAKFKGALEAASGTFSGDLSAVGGTFQGTVKILNNSNQLVALDKDNTLNENTSKTNVGLGNLENPSSLITPLGEGNAAGDINANITTISGSKITAGTLSIAQLESNSTNYFGSGNVFQFEMGTNTSIAGFTGAAIFRTSATNGFGIGGLANSSSSVAVMGQSGNNSTGSYGAYFANSTALGSPNHRRVAGFCNNAKAGIFASDQWPTSATAEFTDICDGTYSIKTNGDVYVDGDFHVTGTVTPFTGMHDGVMEDTISPAVGDILVDSSLLIRKDIANTLFLMVMSSSANQSAIGIYAGDRPSTYIPVTAAKASTRTDVEDLDTREMDPAHEALFEDRKCVIVNSLGEGQVNVCGENGNIAVGDLIVSSSTAGKGMKQDDDIVRSCTVGKAREAVTFASASTVKQIACIYLCG